jgi:uncharacterized integral membrane protein
MSKFLQSAGSNFVILCFGIILGAVLLFFFQNWETLTSTSIELKWLVAVEKPLWFWFALFFLGGTLLAYVWTLKGRFKMAKVQKTMKKQLQEMQTHVHSSEEEQASHSHAEEERHG